MTTEKQVTDVGPNGAELWKAHVLSHLFRVHGSIDLWHAVAWWHCMSLMQIERSMCTDINRGNRVMPFEDWRPGARLRQGQRSFKSEFMDPELAIFDEEELDALRNVFSHLRSSDQWKPKATASDERKIDVFRNAFSALARHIATGEEYLPPTAGLRTGEVAWLPGSDPWRCPVNRCHAPCVITMRLRSGRETYDAICTGLQRHRSVPVTEAHVRRATLAHGVHCSVCGTQRTRAVGYEYIAAVLQRHECPYCPEYTLTAFTHNPARRMEWIEKGVHREKLNEHLGVRGAPAVDDQSNVKPLPIQSDPVTPAEAELQRIDFRLRDFDLDILRQDAKRYISRDALRLRYHMWESVEDGIVRSKVTYVRWAMKNLGWTEGVAWTSVNRAAALFSGRGHNVVSPRRRIFRLEREWLEERIKGDAESGRLQRQATYARELMGRYPYIREPTARSIASRLFRRDC